MANTKLAYVIYSIMLDEIDSAALVWDNNKRASPATWPIDRMRAHKFTEYQFAWNRLQSLYKEFKPKLNRYSFAIMETSIIQIEEIKIDPQERMTELLKYLSPAEFKRE